jgi:hypothetical protein
MTRFETLSLLLTGIYDLLTFLLLVFVVYEGIIKPRLADIAFYYIGIPKDTKQWSYEAQLMDFVLENRGPELKNVRITSEPDNIGWGNLGPRADPKQNIKPRSTSEYFKKTIPYLGRNERHQFFWCDAAHNDVLQKPFKIIIEYDNPAFPLPKRCKKIFEFDFSTFDDTILGVIIKYDMHNIAQEHVRIREELEKLSKSIENIGATMNKSKVE